jgi:hypothetical protein
MDHSDICYLGRIVFDKYLFPPYTPRKALDNRSFPVHDACTFVFAQTKENVKDDQPSLSSSLIRVDHNLIDSLRACLLDNCRKHKSKRQKRYDQV